MILGERLLDELRRIGGLGNRARCVELVPPVALLDTVQIAGDELQPRVVERRAAVVHDRDPPVEIGLGLVTADRQHVVGVPREVAGQIRRLDPVGRLAVGVERPDHGRPAVEVLGQLREADVVGVEPGDDLVADLPDGAVVEREEDAP